MKKPFSIIFSAILCAGLISFVGCSDDKNACEGIYYFHDGSGTLNYKYNVSFDSLHIIYNWTKTRIEFPQY